MRKPGFPQVTYQQAGGSSGEVATLGQRVNALMRGSKNMDLPLEQFLLNVHTDLADHVYQKLMGYAATLHVLGLLAGAIGTAEEQKAARDKLKAAIEAYLNTIKVDKADQGVYFETVGGGDGGGMALAWLLSDWFGWEGTKKQIEEAGRVNHQANQAMGQMVADFFASLWNDLKARWDDFWKDLDEKGLLFAVNKLQIDAGFLAAEIAISVALSVVTEGAAAAAFAGLKIVGQRVGATVTRVVVKGVTRAGQKATARSGILFAQEIADGQIDKRIIKEVFDEDKLGAGSKRPDVGRRAEEPVPPVEKPQGKAAGGSSSKKLARGKNDNEITYDPETGRPIRAKGTLREDFGSTKRGDNATAIGKLGTSGDQGGHLVGHRFMGDTPDYGIAPQAGNLNTGAWKKMENEWADWIKKGYEVDYNIDVIPPGSVRPDAFKSTYVIRDPKTGQIKYKNSKKFKNKDGETFNRIPFRDME